MAADLAGEVPVARSEGQITTTSWTQLRSPEGAAIKADAHSVLVVFAGFIPSITPLKYGRSLLRLFESPEHEGMAAPIRLQLSENEIVPSTTPLPLSNGAMVTYQQTIALAGDFYGIPSAPISDGGDFTAQQARFRNVFSSTFDNGDPAQITNILNIMDTQNTAVTNALPLFTGSADAHSQAYTMVNQNHAYDMQYNQATGGSGGSDWLLHPGTYLQLAGTNWDHFGNHAVAAYQAGHSVAMEQAVIASQSPDGSSERRTAMLRAYAMEAFCAHFLSDLFSAGHLRTPRKALHHNIDPFPDLLSQMMHDEDSYNGLMGSSTYASSQSVTAWPLFGDKRMLDADNATNLAFAQAALQVSANEIYHALMNPTATIDPLAFAALSLIPMLNKIFPLTNKQNWPALFYRDDEDQNDPNNDPSDIEFRVPVTDLDSTSYLGMDTLGFLLAQTHIFMSIPSWIQAFTDPYQHLAYLVIWLALPAGGVHSIEGAPPGYLKQLKANAHSFAWAASYALKDANMSAIPSVDGPAATVGITGLVDDGHPIDDATHANDILHVFYRQDETQGVMHLTTPMQKVVNQGFAGSWSTACSVETLNLSTNGQVAAIDTAGLITIVFPDTNGNLMQSVITPQGGLDPNGPQRIFGNAIVPGIGMISTGTAALASADEMLILAYCSTIGLLLYATATPGSGTPYFTWRLPTGISVGGSAVMVSDNPSIIVVDDYLYLAVGGSGSGGPFPIKIYRAPITDTGLGTWEIYLNGVKDAKGNVIKTASFAQLFNYADGYAVVAKDPSDGSLFTVAPLRTYAPKQAWTKHAVTVPNPLLTVPATTLTQTTRSTVSAIFYGGNPYMFFAAKDTTDLSMVTSNPVQNTLR